MRLWTVQPIEVYNQVMSAGGYSVNLSHADCLASEFEFFREAYAWLHDKAVDRGLEDNGRGMIWAWYRRGKLHRKPDIRTLRKTCTPGEELCCMTLEVPDDKVLLMDTDQWTCRLNRAACTTAEEDAMNLEEIEDRLEAYWALPEEEQRKYAESTWDLVFDTSRATRIEAVFFGLDRSMVRGTQFFTGEGRSEW